MTTRGMIDPELLDALTLLPPLDLDMDMLALLRAAMPERLPPVESYARHDVEITNMLVPGPTDAPDVGVLVYRPTAPVGALPAFLRIHGGGYVFGSAADTGPGDVRTASELGCVVVSVEYRLAPETVAPGAVEDCYAVLRWLHGNAAELGIDPARIAIGGESAGGGIAAALALLARDRGEIALCFQMLIYPMLDDRTATQTLRNPHVGEFVWSPDANLFGWQCFLGHTPGGDAVSAYAAPARAESLAGLPPTYLSVGALDLFLEEGLDYARRLLRAGVATELHVFPGAYHGFELAAESHLARTAEQERRIALRRAFAAVSA